MTPSFITSVEVNFLVFRYLQESGFTHSAFNLGYEAGIDRCSIDGNSVPSGALITFIQKGLQYVEMEANMDDSGADVDEDFSFLKPIEIITKDVDELRQIIKERKQNSQKDKELDKGHAGECGRLMKKARHQRQKKRERERDRIEMGNECRENRVPGGPESMDICTTSTSHGCEITCSDVTVLEGHASEVFACAWSPTSSLLASGSADSTARIWTIADRTTRSTSQNHLLKVSVQKHTEGGKPSAISSLDWNGEGTLLATGSLDGQLRIWWSNGELKSTLMKQRGAIFSLKWNKKSDYLLCGSADKTAVVWDVEAEECKQCFGFHQGSVLDVDWRSNVSFATASSDKMIYVCKIGESQPVITLAGHQGDVNCVKWDPRGLLLASCSDDLTAKIWSTRLKNYVHDLREHSAEIYTIKWSPSGPGTKNPNQQLVLASASYDTTVKLWDVELGRLIYSLDGHRAPVYSIAFSPNGEYLASGSSDRSIHIWSLKEGRIVKTYAGKGVIYEVCWNKDGDKVAACSGNKTVCVLNLRM